MQQPNLVIVQSFGNRPEAELAKGMLEDAGIQALIKADTVGGMRDRLTWSGAGFQILVREDDRTAARNVLTRENADDEDLGDFPSDTGNRRRFT